MQAAFLATRPSVKSHHYAVVATDRRILLLALDWTGLRTTRLAGEVPRKTRLGPCSGLLHPLPVFGNDLAVNRRFSRTWMKPTALRNPHPAIHLYHDHGRRARTGEGRKDTRVPGSWVLRRPGRAGWHKVLERPEWSPLFPAGLELADTGKVGNFPAQVLSPLPERDGSWQYAAGMARKAGVSTALYAALAVLLLAVALVMHPVKGLGAIGLLSALRTFGQWRVRRRWIKLDRVATGLVGTGDSSASPGDDLGEGADAP